MAANAGRRGAAELLACAARRADGAAAANGPAPARNVDRSRRPASIEVLAGLVARHQVPEPRPRRHPVHDAARGISVPSVPIHAARRHRGRIVDRQPQPDPDRAPHRDVRKYDRSADRPVGRSEFQRGPAARPAGDARRLPKPGPADRGDPAGPPGVAQHGSEHFVSGDVHSAKSVAESPGTSRDCPCTLWTWTPVSRGST